MQFALVIHNHQPVGNRDDIIEEIYMQCYLPFLQKLTEYPAIKVNLHYTGFLLEWFEEHHPEVHRTLARIGRLGKSRNSRRSLLRADNFCNPQCGHSWADEPAPRKDSYTLFHSSSGFLARGTRLGAPAS